MSQTPAGPVIELKPVPLKRYLALAMLYLLTGLLAWVAVFQPPAALGWHVFLWGFALATLVLANATGKATAQSLHLREDGLFSADGVRLVDLADIRAVERGAFAFKPSNGFLLRLKTKQPRGWAPGLWWRWGHLMGIGGVTNKVDANIMAETLATMLVRRDTP
ncbi:hypothetical protein [Tropicimonas sp. S265A]|uniref:hypothetical protein n=1 Tax=Tropicimonas sp. S265A TaxID=3415134 RepID=UPI003C7C4156